MAPLARANTTSKEGTMAKKNLELKKSTINSLVAKKSSQASMGAAGKC